VFPKWDRYPKVGQSPNAVCSYSYAVFLVILVYVKCSPGLQKVAGSDGSMVPKVGLRPKMGQNEFNSACVSVVFTFIFLVYYSPYVKPAGHGSIGLLQARFFSHYN